MELSGRRSDYTLLTQHAPPQTNRPSSGSSFADESSTSSDHYAAASYDTASATAKSWAQKTEESYRLQLALALRLSDDPCFLDPLRDDVAVRALVRGSPEVLSHRFWSYRLQLALALRLSDDATCADDPGFLDPVPDDVAVRSGNISAPEVLSHRFWSYRIQLALALRLSDDATCADDPNFLDPVPDDMAVRSVGEGSPEMLSHRFWVGDL